MPALRILGAADAALLAALHPLGFAESWDAAAFATMLEFPGTFGFLAGATEPQGFILCRVATDEAEILTLMVVPKHRRTGIGGALLESAVAAARAAGAASLFLEVAEDNDAARRFYAAHHFAQVGRRHRYYRNAVDALILRRAIAPPF